jgi:hypothetical protein
LEIDSASIIRDIAIRFTCHGNYPWLFVFDLIIRNRIVSRFGCVGGYAALTHPNLGPSY